MNERIIQRKIFDDTFRKYAKTVKVYLRSTKTKSDHYDPYRNTGYSREVRNWRPIKALTKASSPEGLIIKELGLTESGSMQLVVKNSDVPAFKNSNRVVIDDEEYYIYNDAVGSRFQVFPLRFGYSRILTFRKHT